MDKGDVRNYPRLTVRVSPDELERLKYWSSKKEKSINDYVRDAIASAIARENLDYDYSTIEQARLNQLVDHSEMILAELYVIESRMSLGFDSMLSLTRGHTSSDNYLIDKDDDYTGGDI